MMARYEINMIPIWLDMVRYGKNMDMDMNYISLDMK